METNQNIPATPEKDTTEATKNVGSETAAPKKKKAARIIMVVVLSIILLFSGILIFQNISKNKDAAALENKIKAEMGIMDGMTAAEIQEMLSTVVEEGQLRIGINMNPIFIDGKSEGDLDIENHPSNHYDMKCVIVCDLNENGKIEEGETLYHSGLMPINKDEPDPKNRGSHISTDTLEVELPAGNYECTAMFTAYDTESGIQVGGANASIKISVLN